VATKFVMAAGELPEYRGSADTVVGDVVRTRLRILRVIHGAVSEAELVVDLTVDHEERIRRLPKMLVLLVMDDKGGYRALGWELPRDKLACLPASIVDEELGASLPIRIPSTGMRCAKL